VSRLALWLGVLGLALVTGLVLREGLEAVMGSLSVAGFGLVWAALVHAVPMAFNAGGFRVLLPRTRRGGYPFFFWLVWVREAVDSLLPVIRVGGALAAARLMMRRGIRAELAVGGLVVDTTVSLVTQFLFVVLGLGLLLVRVGGNALTVRLGLACLVAVPVIVAFVLVQRMGPFALGARALRVVLGDRLPALVPAARLDRVLRRLYRRSPALVQSAILQFLGWAGGALELSVALVFLGHPASLSACLILHSLTQAVSSVFFFVPGALGVQEAGFVGLAALTGLDPKIGLALALARRVRDVVVFGPCVVAYEIQEARAVGAPQGSFERSTRPAERKTS
jgi:putative membrane protein